MNKITALLFVIIATAGCDDLGGQKTSGSPPQLWSDHKQLSVPVEVCAAKAQDTLTSLGFTSVVRNGDYSYGNLNSNRAAVKCVQIHGGSFVYFAVAGPEKKSVEKLRNKIALKF